MIDEKYHCVSLVKKPQSLIKVGIITLTLLMSPVLLKGLINAPKDIQNILSLHQRRGRVADSEAQPANLAKENTADMATSLPPAELITYR